VLNGPVAVGWECPECHSDTAHWYGFYTVDDEMFHKLSCVKCGMAWDSP
jgi:hypothetical protein